MYDQATRAAVRRSSIRYSYGGVTARQSVRQDRSRSSSRGQERVRLIQLAVCLVLFLTIFLCKGVFPQRLEQVRSDILALITTDLDIQGVLTDLGRALEDGDTVFSDLGRFCVEVFGGDVQEAPAEPVDFVPPEPAGVLTSELQSLGQGGDAVSRTANFARLALYGVELDPVEEAPIQEPEAPAVGSEPVEAPPAVPAVGTVVSVSDYSGQALPNNYTMDQISLGELETMTPVLGHLNSEYGYRDHPIDGRYQFHGGVDIGGHTGDPIAAFAAGTVEYTGKDDSYGLYLQVDHGNGVKSFYAHCSKVVVTKGQKVDIGEKVAEVGSSGSATGPHLHLELKYNKMHLDPSYYVDFIEG